MSYNAFARSSVDINLEENIANNFYVNAKENKYNLTAVELHCFVFAAIFQQVLNAFLFQQERQRQIQ